MAGGARRDVIRDRAPAAAAALADVAVPLGSLAVAFVVMTSSCSLTGTTRRVTRSARLFDTAFARERGAQRDARLGDAARSSPGLCAAVAFRMKLFNIGGEGQLYIGAITGAAAGIALGDQLARWLSIPAMIVAGAAGGAALALIPACCGRSSRPTRSSPR